MVIIMDMQTCVIIIVIIIILREYMCYMIAPKKMC